jgi:Zn-dependent protease/CBS domain-containing protein
MFQVLRISGIPVRIDVSWLLVFALISWSLAAGYFPQVLPELGPGAAWLHGVGAAALLFASVLVHELSHALVARRHGMRVIGIRLHLFGGVSELASEPPTPRAELLVAAVGPLTSFALAGVFYALGRVGTGAPWLAALTGYLAVVNLMLALFNLVPGFPLDGGRVLRALLWWGSGRWDWATRWAGRAGSLFAGLLMVLGVLRTMGGDVVGGLWFILLGLFLHQAAQAGHELARVRARLAPLRVADVMTPRPLTVEAVTPLESVRRRPLGPDDVVTPQASAWQAFLKITGSGGGRVAVVEDGRLVGLVTRQDLQQALTDSPARATSGERAA